MSRPAKKRDFRRIVVDAATYQWRFDRELTVVADLDSGNRGQRLNVTFGWVDWCEPEYQKAKPFAPHVVTPAFVRSAIQYALTVGWRPQQTGQPFIVTHREGVFERKS